MSQRSMYAEHLNGGNDVAMAITIMRHMFHAPSGMPAPGARPGVKRIGVVFTYNNVEPSERQRVVDAARDAKSDGIILYAVGKGRAGPEFGAIGSDYCKSFSMGRFIDGLPSVLAFLGSSICSEMDPTVNVTAQNCFPRKFYLINPKH